MQTYLVGGAVRDKLLGIEPHEHDWVVVGASPEELTAKGYQQVGKDFPVFLHPETRDEYALARTERKSGHGYKGFQVSFDKTVTLEQDLIRRDLTINAIAEDSTGHLIDPFGGQQDIAARQLRHVSPAFSEDPLRVLRVARFYARFHHLGFRIAAETWQLLSGMVTAGELSHLTPERVWKEWEKALNSQSPSIFLSTLDELQAIPQVLPQLSLSAEALNRQQRVCDRQNNPEVRFASLFLSPQVVSDIKPFCAQLAIPNRFRDAAELAQQQADVILQDSALSAEQVFDCLNAIDYWRRPERLALLLALREAVQSEPQQNQSIAIHQAAQAAQQIDAKALMAAGYRGKEIGEAMQQQRWQLINQEL